ncbi:hypothetical protein RN001_010665 [Aquatica leii]|uniref:Uncharacterized protein n=1 Tax=Aquatica leii TaxID=1421715 RepID=A0AAN7SG64_9COLE|nr:hypothetical protein RN001_010665 [Aquatica leii]
MRLFFALCRRRHMPNGHIHRGKDRIIKPVTKDDYWKLKTNIEIEEKNMFYLRNSYLTKEQSHGHSKALNIPQDRLMSLIKRKRKFYDDVTLESRLGHLRYSEAWE